MSMKIVYVVNRTTVPLEVMDDGRPWVIRPGYKAVARMDDDGNPVMDPDTGEPAYDIVGSAPNGQVQMEPLDYFAAERAKRQNPVMGTANPYDPTSFQSLIAVPDWGDDYSHIEQTMANELIDRTLLPLERQQGAQAVTMSANAPFVAPGRAKQPTKAVPGQRPVALRTSELTLGPSLGDNSILTTQR